MLKTKHLLFIFIPAIFLVVLGLFIRVIQYNPLVPDELSEDQDQLEITSVPIFPDDPIIGDKKAGITLVAFEDFGCPLCKDQNEIFNQILSKYPKRIKIIWKGLAVTQFPVSTELAQKYGYCANEQRKFTDFKELAFVNNTNLTPEILEIISSEIKLNQKKLQSCLESEEANLYIEQVKQVAGLLNVQAVPTVFIEGKQVNIPNTAQELELILNLSE